MDIHQLKTFTAVAREGSITKASNRLHLSQPAVSAHIKAMEETLGLALFDRSARGMSLTSDGKRLLEKAEETLAAHRDLLEEAARMKGHLSGKLRLGSGTHGAVDRIGKLIATLAEQCPDVEVTLRHSSAADLIKAIRDEELDGGFYIESDEADEDLTSIEIARMGLYLTAPPGLIEPSASLDWQALASHPWILCPSANSCCGQAAESLFLRHNFRPDKVIHIDREAITRTLVAGGVGLGLLQADTALEAERAGEAELICEAQDVIRILFVHARSRDQDPILSEVRRLLRTDLLP